ncbi:MAG: phage tail assembly chaperone [Rhodobacteraceae bacterium]|nr:phage tail assembly chaperone [Paracoccaceae bacterium]
MTQVLDWAVLMKVGLHHLRLNPEVFWRLTPVELAIMMGGTGGCRTALSRSGLEALCAKYPDRTME